MIDIMPCQMCGTKPYPPNDDFPYVECENDNCWISGPRNYKEESAIEIWNRMQGYIARGKLLDESPKKQGGRL